MDNLSDGDSCTASTKSAGELKAVALTGAMGPCTVPACAAPSPPPPPPCMHISLSASWSTSKHHILKLSKSNSGVDKVIDTITLDQTVAAVISLDSAAEHVCQVLHKEKIKASALVGGKENSVNEVVPDKPTLVLDLDETLVHASNLPVPGYDFVVTAGKDLQYYVKLRPFVYKFLTRVAELYNVILFTASKRSYADKVVQRLDPKGTIFSNVLYRRACTVVGHGQFSKDLTQLGLDLSRVCLVDNQLVSFLHQPHNGIPIRSFVGDTRDRELLYLLPFLEKLSTDKDVRPAIAHKFPATARLALNHARMFPMFRRAATTTRV